MRAMEDARSVAHAPTLAVGPRDDRDDVQLAPGTVVGEYAVERFIGAGAMGEVYAGRHPVIGKRVAIKVLRHELAASAEAAERFIREARAVNQIEHENVVDVFACGRLDDGRLYLVMDLVEGRSLRAALVNGPLEPSAALDILEPIADALDAAHARGVVHRDLKPDNIVLSTATPPKVFVLDFGIAKLISTANEGAASGPGTLTGAGTWLGTPGYMAPEQWSADGAGPASDRYALGVIAFELLAGAQPFSASSAPGMMEQHFRAEVPALSARGAVGIPPAVDAVLRKALAKDPDARYATARELVAALRDAFAETGRAHGAIAAPDRTRPPWLAATAGVGILGVALVVVVMMRERSAGTAADRAPDPASAALPTDRVTVDVVSSPSGAEVRDARGVLGTTPAQLTARPGETLELTVRKPGYTPARRTVTAGPSGAVVTLALDEVDRFNGVWRLRGGELRAFERRGEGVDVHKLTEVHGARTFFKQYRFELSDHGVAFGGEEVVVDPRAPEEPSCHIRMRVVYQYDPMHDVLEQQREKVQVDLHGGTCVVRSRQIEPSRLERVDQPHDTREISAPIGTPLPDERMAEEALTKRPTKTPTKRAPTKPPPKKSALDAKLSALSSQQAPAEERAPAQKQARVEPFVPTKSAAPQVPSAPSQAPAQEKN